jgi:hypothetical protein
MLIQVKSAAGMIWIKTSDSILATKLRRKFRRADRAYIGYSLRQKRTNKTVTLGLLEAILPNLEMITLIGRELWILSVKILAILVNLFEVLIQVCRLVKF